MAVDGTPVEIGGRTIRVTNLDKVELSDRELAMAEQLIESLQAEFDPTRFGDTYRHQVLELIDRKAAGEEVVFAPAAPEADRVVDLMAALEASVKAAKEARRRHPAARAVGSTEPDAVAEDEEEADDEARPVKRAAKRKTA